MPLKDIALTFVPQLGPRGAAYLVESFGSAEAVYAASTAPADAVGLSDIGRIQTGKCADILVLDQNLNLKAVYVDGVAQKI